MNVTAIHQQEPAATVADAAPAQALRPSWAPNLTPLADEHRLQPVPMRKPDRALARAILRSMQRIHGPIVIDYHPNRQEKTERVLRHEGLIA